jgi:branched-chain amino acid transport system substrate-binding protein
MPHAIIQFDGASAPRDRTACGMTERSPLPRPHRRDWLRAVACVGCAAVLAACSANSSTQTVGSISAEAPKDPAARALDAKSPVKVAMLLPLTGSPQTAAVAKGLQQAAELALFERNAPSLQLIIKDDKGTEDGARAAAEDAVKGGAELIIGPLFAKSVAAIAPIGRQARVPIIAFSNDTRVAGNGVYLLSFLASQDVPRITSFTVAQGHTRIAALLPDDALGKIQEQLFRAAVERGGGTVAVIEHYPVDVNGMVAPVQRIRDAIRTADETGEPIQALFLPGGQDTLPLIGPLLPKSAIDTQRVKIVGTGGWDYPNAGRERILEGGWFAAPDPGGWRDFSERFAKSYKTMPPRLASLAYDAVGIATTFSAGPKDGRYTIENLTRASGFTGIDGAFRLLANGTSERDLAVLEMQKFGLSVIDRAPGIGAAPRTMFGTAQVGFN